VLLVRFFVFRLLISCSIGVDVLITEYTKFGADFDFDVSPYLVSRSFKCYDIDLTDLELEALRQDHKCMYPNAALITLYVFTGIGSVCGVCILIICVVSLTYLGIKTFLREKEKSELAEKHRKENLELRVVRTRMNSSMKRHEEEVKKMREMDLLRQLEVSKRVEMQLRRDLETKKMNETQVAYLPRFIPETNPAASAPFQDASSYSYNLGPAGHVTPAPISYGAPSEPKVQPVVSHATKEPEEEGESEWESYSGSSEGEFETDTDEDQQ